MKNVFDEQGIQLVYVLLYFLSYKMYYIKPLLRFSSKEIGKLIPIHQWLVNIVVYLLQKNEKKLIFFACDWLIVWGNLFVLIITDTIYIIACLPHYSSSEIMDKIDPIE